MFFKRVRRGKTLLGRSYTAKLTSMRSPQYLRCIFHGSTAQGERASKHDAFLDEIKTQKKSRGLKHLRPSHDCELGGARR
jgi:hypothetical protein